MTMTVSGESSHLSEFVDRRVGIVRSCRRLTKDRDEPTRPYVFQAVLANYDLRRAPAVERTGTGKGMSQQQAREGAIVEALERYCAGQRRYDGERFGPSDSLDAPAIAPEELVLYSHEQYARVDIPYRRPVAFESLTWVRGHLVGSGQPIYAPAAFVYLVAEGGFPSELFTQSTSSGLAGGATLPSAVLAGLYELIERDAFVIAWVNRLPAPRLTFANDEGISAEIRHHYRRVGIEIVAFALTNDLNVPVVMAVALETGGRRPFATIGLGCNVDPRVALDRAVMEVVQLRTALVPRHRARSPVTVPREEVRTPLDHADFFAIPESRDELGFLLDGETELPLEEIARHGDGTPASALDYCRERLEAAGSTVAYVDLTQPDLAPSGVRIVRAIATGLQPIHFGFGNERLGGQRIHTVPRILGYDRSSESELNRCPHPLA
jgi:ribosomal protein S12 methylthiotransferase accessory factor